MKKIILPVALLLLLSCADSTQKTDNEKEGSEENKIEVKAGDNEIKVSDDGVSVEAGTNKSETDEDDTKDTASIKINAKDGIKVDSKDGKVDINEGGMEVKDKSGTKVKVDKNGVKINL